MCSCKQSTQKDADTGNDNIGNPKEGIPATHDSAGTDQDGFGAIVDGDGKVFGKGVSSLTRSSGHATMALFTYNHRYQFHTAHWP